MGPNFVTLMGPILVIVLWLTLFNLMGPIYIYCTHLNGTPWQPTIHMFKKLGAFLFKHFTSSFPLKTCWLFDAGCKTVFVIVQIIYFAMTKQFFGHNQSQTINLSAPLPGPNFFPSPSSVPNFNTTDPSFNLTSSHKSTPRSILKRPNFDDTSLNMPLSPLVHPAPVQDPNSIEVDSAYVSNFNNSTNV